MSTQDFLLEIGTEELPPKNLQRLSQALSDNLKANLEKAELSFGEIESFATPRRLAVRVKDLLSETQAQTIERRGPAIKAAFKDDGSPTPAATGFAKSCNTTVEQLEQRDGYLHANVTTPAEKTANLLPEIVNQAVKKLPIAKPMRWSDFDTEFVRPVHWVVMLLGSDVVNGTVLGKPASNQTFGHRFHYLKPITLKKPSDYESSLEKTGYVIASFAKRREQIKQQVLKATPKNLTAVIDEDLLDEVTAINEWPTALCGNFDNSFLVVPKEALISAMQQHQKYFPVVDKEGKLQPHFITISNIESKDPKSVINGNERVLRARLSDAEFFYQTDSKHDLGSFATKLESIVFQNKLGTMAEKSDRTVMLAAEIAKQIKADVNMASRAAELAKADLLSEMVGEFPELQGTMGYYYAQKDQESEEIALAIKEHYLPRFAGDSVPQNLVGCAVALADKIDTLIGIFGINMAPTGEKDPFALRRAALGMLRIIIEHKLNLDLNQLFENAIAAYGKKLDNKNTATEALQFVLDRLRTWYHDQGIDADVFAAVMARHPTKPLDFDLRVKAVQHFQTLPQAKALAAANKRVSNILKKQGVEPATLNSKLLKEPAESELANLVIQKDAQVKDFYAQADYTQALSTLAELQQPVDRFFDDVMVMVDDAALRDNRLALLNNLRNLFLQVADISLLQQ